MHPCTAYVAYAAQGTYTLCATEVIQMCVIYDWLGTKLIQAVNKTSSCIKRSPLHAMNQS